MTERFDVKDNVSMEAATRYLLGHLHVIDAKPPMLFFKRQSVFVGGENLNRPFSEECVIALLDAMERSTVAIQHVAIDPNFLQPIQTPATVDRFFQVIGSLSKLDQLHWFARDRRDRQGQSLQYLARLLTLARGLKRFDCCMAVFSGTNQDFLDFANSLRSHPSLSAIRFSTCRLAERNQTAMCIDPVLRSFRSIPNLTSIGPSCWAPPSGANEEDFGSTVSALKELCQHPKLIDLTFHDCRLGRGAYLLGPIMETIQSSDKLQNLSFKVKLQEEECRHLTNVIRDSKSLISLGLSVDDRDGQGGGNRVDQGGDANFIQIVKAFEGNSTISTLTVCCGFGRNRFVPSQSAGGAIVSMLEKNTTLTDVNFVPSLVGTDCNFLPEMNFWLKLNKAGRKSLLQCPISSHNRWIRMLAKVSGDVPALFYLLSLNPALCDPNQKRKRKALFPVEPGARRRAKRRRKRQEMGAEIEQYLTSLQDQGPSALPRGVESDSQDMGAEIEKYLLDKREN